MDEREPERTLEGPAVGSASEESAVTKSAAMRRRDALFRIASVVALPILPALLSESCGAANYSKYCNATCQNFHLYGSTYCNYSDYYDAGC